MNMHTGLCTHAFPIEINAAVHDGQMRTVYACMANPGKIYAIDMQHNNIQSA